VVAGENERLLLLSSDRRRRYAEDVLTALALPVGSVIQFRYDANYVVPALQRSINDVVGWTATLAFVAGHDTENPFLVPVRLATVLTATCVADIFIFRLRVGGYVDLDNYPRTEESVAEASRRILHDLRLANGGSFYPAVRNCPGLHMAAGSEQAEQWLAAARRLVLHSTFATSYFVRIDPPMTQSGQQLAFNAEGRLVVVDQESVRFNVHFYSNTYDEDVRPLLACDTDGTFVRVASDDRYELALRYDSVEFWLHPGIQSFDTLTRATFSLRSQAGAAAFVPVIARFPITVRRSKSRMSARIAASGGGALLVALPAVVAGAAPVELRVAAAVVGAALLALANVVFKPAG
jgi:hypothetical protein